MTAQTFREEYVKYGERLRCSMLGVVRNHEDAEDIAAWTFTTAFKKRKDFRGEACFYSWLHRIALNQAWTLARRKRAVSLDAMEGFEPKALIEPNLLDQQLDRQECCRRIRAALRRLPGLYRRTLVDHFVRGQKVREIARQNRIPVGTVLSRLFKGKEILRQAWVRTQSASNYRPQ
jgi:RNA polymerase sigma-70 factor (ECF subfamily)